MMMPEFIFVAELLFEALIGQKVKSGAFIGQKRVKREPEADLGKPANFCGFAWLGNRKKVAAWLGF
jgi:hypothetical protein